MKCVTTTGVKDMVKPEDLNDALQAIGGSA
jgi:hypothetical protein